MDTNPHWQVDDAVVHVDKDTVDLRFIVKNDLLLQQLGEGRKLNLTEQSVPFVDWFSLDGFAAATQAAYQACMDAQANNQASNGVSAAPAVLTAWLLLGGLIWWRQKVVRDLTLKLDKLSCSGTDNERLAAEEGELQAEVAALRVALAKTQQVAAQEVVELRDKLRDSGALIERLSAEVAELRVVLAKTQELLADAQSFAIPDDIRKYLRALTHPNRWAGSHLERAATLVSQWLNAQHREPSPPNG